MPRGDNGQFLPVLPQDINDADILRRIADGTRVSDIATELGVVPSALYHRYQGNKDYATARMLGTEARIDWAEKGIETAAQPLTLARAREAHRAVAWRASVEHPERWGQQRDVAKVPAVQINIALRRSDAARPDALHNVILHEQETTSCQPERNEK